MNRWLIRGLVVLVLIALITWIARNTYWDDITVPTFPRGEAARNPFYAAQRLAEELGATAEWRRALGDLPEENGVLMLTHWNWDLIETRRVELERWVESGGRLLVDSSLVGGSDAFERWSGIAIAWHVDEDEVEEVEEPEDDAEIDIPTPCRDLDLAHGRAYGDQTRESYGACGLEIVGWLTSQRELEWALEDEQGLQAVRVRVGDGSVTMVHGVPFGNRQLLEAENAVLFVDAIELHRGDHVVFVSEAEHASLLALIWIYGAPAVVLALALIALALWRGSMRFGPLEAMPDGSRRSLAEQIRGTGQFVLRVGGGRALHAAMVRALHEAARLRIPKYEGMTPEDRIEAVARIAQLAPEQLAETINFSGQRRPHDFKNAVALLDIARSRVIAFKATRINK